jgi:hypothetical protein
VITDPQRAVVYEFNDKPQLRQDIEKSMCHFVGLSHEICY